MRMFFPWIALDLFLTKGSSPNFPSNIKKFSEINQFLFPLKSSENQMFCNNSRGKRSLFICLNLRNVRSETLKISNKCLNIASSISYHNRRWCLWILLAEVFAALLQSILLKNISQGRHCVILRQTFFFKKCSFSC